MSESQTSQPDPEQPGAEQFEQPAGQAVEQEASATEPNRRSGAILTTGELVFSVLTPEGPSERKVDLLWLKLTCEEAERDNSLQVDAEGRQQATALFLDDLSSRLSAKVADCTPTMAYQMWLAASEAMNELKNAMSGMLN